MDILGEILKQVIAGASQPQAAPQRQQPQSRPAQPPTGMPSPDDLGEILGQIFGGGSAQKLPDVVKQFEERGMRDQVDSWVRTGPNKPVERQQIEDVFGQRELEELARRRGVDRDQLAEVLAKYIPRIIDELTPAGQLTGR
ncbi:MAG: YidB family protein [Pirellulales bacterium]